MMKLGLLSPSTDLLPLSSSVFIGQRAIVHVWGRNDVSTRQYLGIHWLVKDPDGLVVQDYSDWSLLPYAYGEEHGFMASRFDLDKSGIYTIELDLLMNRDNPVIVDSYKGDLCTVTTELPPEYELIQHTIYPFAYIYDGDVEATTATFKTDPFTPSAWAAQKFADALESEARKQGGRVLEVKAYVDKTPLFWTDYRIEVIGTPLGGAVGSAPGIAAIPIWLAILIIALAIIAVIVVATLAFKTIMETFKRKPGLEDAKVAWGKETLILAISDSEEYWERPLTPVETLEGMSEAELRDYLDQIAEEEVVPPEVSWLPLAIIGGLGVLGVGIVAVALAARPKE